MPSYIMRQFGAKVQKKSHIRKDEWDFLFIKDDFYYSIILISLAGLPAREEWQPMHFIR